MAVECIHGLDEGLCDTCYPKAVVEQPAAPRTPAVRRTPGTRSAAPRVAGAPVTKLSTLDVAAQRIYHVTHINNLEAILGEGSLVAGAVPAVDVSSEINRELRRTAEVAPGRIVAEYVPFFLAPTATLWVDLRDGAVGAHWSAEARAAAPSDFVMLVTSLGALGAVGESDAVLSDGDPAHSLTRFAATDSTERMLRRLHDTEDALLDAEALALGSVPFEAITVIGVANNRARDAVRALLAASSFTPKVAVYPPWFTAELAS